MSFLETGFIEDTRSFWLRVYWSDLTVSRPSSRHNVRRWEPSWSYIIVNNLCATIETYAKKQWCFRMNRSWVPIIASKRRNFETLDIRIYVKHRAFGRSTWKWHLFNNLVNCICKFGDMYLLYGASYEESLQLFPQRWPKTFLHDLFLLQNIFFRDHTIYTHQTIDHYIEPHFSSNQLFLALTDIDSYQFWWLACTYHK